MPDVDFDTLGKRMMEVLGQGGTVYAKWTCIGCGERATANEPNELHTSYIHEDCGVETSITLTGGGFTAVFLREYRGQDA